MGHFDDRETSTLRSDGRQPPLSVPHGFEDDARGRLLRSRPPVDALAWVETALDATVTRVRPLKGGRSSAIHALRVRTSAGDDTVVLRRYVVPEIVAEERHVAAREAHALELLGGRFPVPRLLAVDRTGTDAGVPAVLMSRVPGRLDWAPTAVEPWVDGLVAVLPALHAMTLPAGHGIGDFEPYPPERWQAPEWLRRPALWDRALDVFRAAPLDPGRALIHRDYHPGNVLWRGGKVSGVVDWQSASVGPPSVDVAWCRLNVLGRFGSEVGDRVVARWEEVSGRTYHPWAEVVLLVDVMGRSPAPKRQERDDLERTLARRLSELVPIDGSFSAGGAAGPRPR
jgi:aminoglycoside phosphotransferase (APT) family kinase protein